MDSALRNSPVVNWRAYVLLLAVLAGAAAFAIRPNAAHPAKADGGCYVNAAMLGATAAAVFVGSASNPAGWLVIVEAVGLSYQTFQVAESCGNGEYDWTPPPGTTGVAAYWVCANGSQEVGCGGGGGGGGGW